MKKTIDKIDFLIASIMAVVIALWAFLWAEPYPRPSLWPYLAKLHHFITPQHLSIAGKLSIGFFGAMIYMIIRRFWLERLHSTDRRLDPNTTVRERMMALCGALIFCSVPQIWRSAQFLSPEFIVLFACIAGLFFWQQGRGYNKSLLYFLAYSFFGFATGLNPISGALFVLTLVLDVIARFQMRLDEKSFAGPVDAQEGVSITYRNSVEVVISMLGALGGFSLAVLIEGGYNMVGKGLWTVPSLYSQWFSLWMRTFTGSVSSFYVVVIILAVAFEILAVELARRVAVIGSDARVFARLSTTFVVLVTFIIGMRTIDGPERTRLAVIRDYVRTVVAELEGVKWFFTDGRFDDAIRFELGDKKDAPFLLEMMRAPSEDESARLRAVAPNLGERDVFSAGGSEVFRAWARESPDHLHESAWQLGSGIVRFYGKVGQRTYGSIIKSLPKEEGDLAAFKAADERFVAFSRTLPPICAAFSRWGAVTGSVDDEVSRKFDEVLWRAARISYERSQQFSDAEDKASFKIECDLMRQLDSLNVTLRQQGEALERILPTYGMVLTAREGLTVSLRRADFDLAQRYAREVLRADANDVDANFAMGMACLETKDYKDATFYLSNVLKFRPNEPAALNNLALAYFKMGQIEYALELAERALKAHPTSKEVQKNLEEIRKVLKAEKLGKQSR